SWTTENEEVRPAQSEEKPVSTDAIHAGWDPAADGHRALTPPVHTASAYAQTSHAALKALFQRRASGYAYSRSGNPTTSVLQQRISALERGPGAIAVASGQAATPLALFARAAPGGHGVASTRLYGRATGLPDGRLAHAGVRGTPGAHARDVPVVVDSTLASPALYRPGEHGADVVVHSATKYLCGHGTTIAGLIVDTGRFDPRRCPHRWPQLTERNRRFGVTFADEY